MKVTINNSKYNDSYTFQAKDIIQAREIVHAENKARGWDADDCWSEVEDESNV